MGDTLVWLTPAAMALFLYGIGQGLVKKYISAVPPARFCLFFVVAKALVNLGYFFTQAHPAPFSNDGRSFLMAGIFAYTLDGAGWILYFKSILRGPITIVGTLSAAYPAITVVLARVFLGEVLVPLQYLGVALVIGGCIGLSYSPENSNLKSIDKSWIPLAASALVLWGAAQTVVKYSYGLPEASEVNLALFNTIGGFLTLGIYGWRFGRKPTPAASETAGETGRNDWQEWMHALLPMGMMAGGDLAVIIASRSGPISVVTPLTAAYPVVTIVFAALVLKERITGLQFTCIALVLVGMYLSPGAN